MNYCNSYEKKIKNLQLLFFSLILLLSINCTAFYFLVFVTKFYKPMLPIIIMISVFAGCLLIAILLIKHKYYLIKEEYKNYLTRENKKDVFDKKQKIIWLNSNDGDIVHKPIFIILIILILLVLFIFCEKLTKFTPEKWCNSIALRPIIINDLFEQNTYDEKQLKYNYMNNRRDELKKIFFMNDMPDIDVQIEIDKSCIGCTYDIYWAYNDNYGNNYWIVFLYPNEDNGKSSQPIILMSKEKLVIGESGYGLSRDPKSILNFNFGG